MLHASSSDDETYAGSSSHESHVLPAVHTRPLDDGAFLMGLAPTRARLTALHPPPVHIFRLWQAYLDYVNPLIKILHAPSMQQVILEAIGDLKNIARANEALMFAIYASAVNSLDNGECESMFGSDKVSLLAKYQWAAQQALIKAGYLKTSSVVVLQAYLLYLVSQTCLSGSVSARTNL